MYVLQTSTGQNCLLAKPTTGEGLIRITSDYQITWRWIVIALGTKLKIPNMIYFTFLTWTGEPSSLPSSDSPTCYV